MKTPFIKEIFEQSNKERVSFADMKKSVLGRRNSKSKGPEAGAWLEKYE